MWAMILLALVIYVGGPWDLGSSILSLESEYFCWSSWRETKHYQYIAQWNATILSAGHLDSDSLQPEKGSP